MTQTSPIMSDEIELECPIMRGETEIRSLKLRRIVSGELRGLSMIDIIKLETDTLHRLLPRITIPPITEDEAKALSAPDFFILASEVGSFFLPKRAKDDSQLT